MSSSIGVIAAAALIALFFGWTSHNGRRIEQDHRRRLRQEE